MTIPLPVTFDAYQLLLEVLPQPDETTKENLRHLLDLSARQTPPTTQPDQQVQQALPRSTLASLYLFLCVGV